MRWSIKQSDLLIVLAAIALLKPCFLKNNDNTAFASSLSAANKLEGIALKLKSLATSDSSAITFKYSNRDIDSRKKKVSPLTDSVKIR